MVSRFADAIAMCERVPRQSWSRGAYARCAGSLALLGRAAEAEQAVADALDAFPRLAYETHAHANPSLSANEKRQYERAMRAAGFPVCAPAEARSKIPEAMRLAECNSPPSN